MLKFFESIWRILSKVFSRDFVSKLLRGIEVAAPYLQVAYDLAQTAAKMTPTRTDDELLALADFLGVQALLDPQQDKGVAISRIVFRALKKRFPDAADRVLNRAIEIAYGALRP